MDEYQPENYKEQDANQEWRTADQATANRWLVGALAVMLVVALMAFAYGHREKSTVDQLRAQAATSNQTVNQLQNQVGALTARLNEMTWRQSGASTSATEATPAEAEAESATTVLEAPVAPIAGSKSAQAKRPTAKPHAPADKRYKQLQAQLADQQKQLKDTQEQVEKYRSDMEGNIHSTRDELSGSIAKTHEELLALEKRGERIYYEFDLSKSKQFERVGPLSVSLRKADTKHKRYDLAMIVDDNELTKKQVNLYEPVSIHMGNESQSIMVVVNRIEKNLVHGYISTPKYKPSELFSASASVAPTAGNAAVGNNTQNVQQPTQPQH